MDLLAGRKYSDAHPIFGVVRPRARALPWAWHRRAGGARRAGGGRLLRRDPAERTGRHHGSARHRRAHDRGQLAFGPDGHLYIALGDGGSGGDPYGNGQSLGTLLGKILRIDPRPSGGRPYGIPRDNPFVDRAGARAEIWDYGLRNPWRFSFDPTTRDLWIADVGQGDWEEVDHEPAGRGGRNYGWNRLEGTHHFDGDPLAGAVGPVIEYGHSAGACTVIGGSDDRGAAIPDLRGAFLYGDYCAGWVKAVTVGDPSGTPRDLGINVPSLTSFGTDQRGEPFALSAGGQVFRIVKG